MTSVPATAQALVAHEPLDGKFKFTLEDVSVRELKDDEVLVRMVATGICHTDLVFASLPNEAGPYCKVLGHEGGGYVEKVGASIAHVKEGNSVLLSFSFCGKCRDCEAHHPSFCQLFSEINCVGDPDVFQNTAGVKAWGGFFGQSSFASLAIAKGTSVVNVTDLIQNEEELKLFAPLGCGFQTGAGTVDKLCSASKQDIVVILGLGGVGLSSVMVIFRTLPGKPRHLN
jgi:Zn-dependent alcohol dehydrogenase